MSDPADPTDLVPGAPSDEEAWSDVLRSWGDEQAHRTYLARFVDMEGLAAGGARYRVVLDERPDDAMALRMRDELLRKATVLGLASLPRTVRAPAPPWLRVSVRAAAILCSVAAIGYAIAVVLRMVRAGP